MKVFAFLTILVFFIGSSCQHIGRQSRNTQEDDIREAVFRYQFQHEGSHELRVYFLSIGSLSQHKDPSPEFMKRFQGHKPHVKKASQSVDSAEGIKDNESGEKGLIFRVSSIEWKNTTEVDVQGGYHTWSWGTSASVYHVVREGNKWVVKGSALIMIT